MQKLLFYFFFTFNLLTTRLMRGRWGVVRGRWWVLIQQSMKGVLSRTYNRGVRGSQTNGTPQITLLHLYRHCCPQTVLRHKANGDGSGEYGEAREGPHQSEAVCSFEMPETNTYHFSVANTDSWERTTTVSPTRRESW